MKRILIKGYYGHKNLGDDFLLYSILKVLNSAGRYHVTVISAGDEYHSLFSYFPNLKCDIFLESQWKKWSKLWCLMRFDYWIIGGGGLFPSEPRSNIPNLQKEIKLAISLKTKVCLYGIDINSINRSENQKAWYNISQMVSFIVCRNLKTQKMLEKLGCSNVIKTGDITFGLNTPEELDPSDHRELLRKLNVEEGKYILWSIPMLWSEAEIQTEECRNRYHKMINTLQSVANSNRFQGYKHVFLPFFYRKDLPLCQELIEGIQYPCVICSDEWGLTYGEKRLLFRYADYCICMRFHSAMFSIYHGKPAIYISYADKTSDVIKEYHLQRFLCEFGFSKNENFYREIDLNSETLLSMIDTLQREKEEVHAELDGIAKNLKNSTLIAQNKLLEWLK